MLHPALARALASAHVDDLHRAAGRSHTIRFKRRAAHEPRVAAPRAGIDLAPPARADMNAGLATVDGFKMGSSGAE